MNKASSYMIILILTQILIPIITPILPNNQNNLQLIFNPPTPSNNTLITNDYVPLNLSIIGEAFSITLDWNKSLLLYLPLDENNGQTIHDLSTYNNSGTLGWTISQEACDPAWINGISGSALEFNGNNIAIIPYKSNYKYLRSELSIDLWIKPYRIDNVDIDLLIVTDKRVYVVEARVKPRHEDIGALLVKVDIVKKHYRDREVIPILTGSLIGREIEDYAREKGIETYSY